MQKCNQWIFNFMGCIRCDTYFFAFLQWKMAKLVWKPISNDTVFQLIRSTGISCINLHGLNLSLIRTTDERTNEQKKGYPTNSNECWSRSRTRNEWKDSLTCLYFDIHAIVTNVRLMRLLATYCSIDFDDDRIWIHFDCLAIVKIVGLFVKIVWFYCASTFEVYVIYLWILNKLTTFTLLIYLFSIFFLSLFWCYLFVYACHLNPALIWSISKMTNSLSYTHTHIHKKWHMKCESMEIDIYWKAERMVGYSLAVSHRHHFHPSFTSSF